MHTRDQFNKENEVISDSVNKLISVFKNNSYAIIDLWYLAQFNRERLNKYNIINIPTIDKNWICSNYLIPLLKLLIGFMESRDHNYLYVYLDERLRYVPYLRDLKEKYLEELLCQEKKSIADHFRFSDDLKNVLFNFYDYIHSILFLTDNENQIHLLSVGDCLMNETRVFLHPALRKNKISIDMSFLYFSASQNEPLSAEQVTKFLEKNPADLIAFSFFTYSGLPFYSMLMNNASKISQEEVANIVQGVMVSIEKLLNRIRNATDAPFLIHNVGGLLINNEGGYIQSQFRKNLTFFPPLSKAQREILAILNEEIENLVNNTENAILVDEKQIVKSRGYSNCLSHILPQRKFGTSLFHTSYFGEFIAHEYKSIIEDFLKLHKAKVLLVDFDNTLWEGVMADGPVTHKIEYQRLLKKIKDSGVVLVAVSKNDPRNIRWEEIAIKEDDFVLTKINWNLKVQSIDEAASELNLGLDSFVLLDDNPVERELVAKHLPMVKVMDSLDDNTWISLKRMLNFPNTGNTEEDGKRTAMYRAQAQRKIVLGKKYDYASMMKMLALKVKFGLAQERHLHRIHELLSRTNQFNATTIRYGKNDIAEMFQDENCAIYTFELEDKFGALGIVGLIIVKRNYQDRVFDSFIMSCRAMGFALEQLMLRLALEKEYEAGGLHFIGKIDETERNMPVRDIYASNGFIPAGNNQWINRDKETWPDRPEWFEVHQY